MILSSTRKYLNIRHKSCFHRFSDTATYIDGILRLEDKKLQKIHTHCFITHSYFEKFAHVSD